MPSLGRPAGKWGRGERKRQTQTQRKTETDRAGGQKVQAGGNGGRGSVLRAERHARRHGVSATVPGPRKELCCQAHRRAPQAHPPIQAASRGTRPVVSTDKCSSEPCVWEGEPSP